MTKAEKIKQALKETKERRKNLRPVVYQLKIQNLSKVREEKLNAVYSITLKQYKVSFDIDFERNRVRIQGLGWFRVLGLHQVPRDCEIANAQLIKKPSGYYVYLTCYVKKEHFERDKVKDAVGIDFGVANKLTLSNGLSIDFEVKESKRLKRLQKELARKKKGSKNREKVLKKLQREYERLTNIRRDIHNKLLAFFRHYGVVVYQDDDIKAWHEGWFGSQVQYAGIGMLKARLRNSLATIPVGRFEATTQECCVCGWKQKLSLSDRVYHCLVCGNTIDRDLNSAINILKKGFDLSPNQVVGVDRPELTPVERELVAKILGSNPYIKATALVEAGSPHFYK
jgi:putative transposase